MLDERQKAQEELQEVLEQRVADFKRSFEFSPGKRNGVYKYLSEFCFENQSTFNASSQSTSNFNEGSRFVILEIKKWLEFDLTKGV
jgi:hypothetical protein